MIDFVTTLTEIICELGVKVKVLCIDREFYTRAVMRYLQSAKIPFIVPVKGSRETDERNCYK
ncbi:hypothetical protein [Methanosarcina lacustris]|uniref:hypothetical protein n=1 Tax=Methanosarcina lacustris TaxID=170861 RepID=UPI00064F03CB|nr:hypothetical protein [Methanosarcina lacustris]